MIFSLPICAIQNTGQTRPLRVRPDYLIRLYGKMMQDAIKDRPDDMVIGMHMCRGNFRSTHAAEGAYDAVADTVFNETGVDVFFMEYDSERAGGLEPLKFLAKGRSG